MAIPRHHDLLDAADALCRSVSRLRFGPPVTHVYHPLLYARQNHTAYLAAYGRGPKRVIFLGMNPGPFGMAQTGVPFGDPALVRTWLHIEGPVGKPDREHPSRPVLGFAGQRSEVSGQRLWGAARDHFGTPERFFRECFVANYCPLCFLEESGRNRTPDKLPAAEREPLFAACDDHLCRVVEVLAPRHVVGVGAFAAARARAALAGTNVEVAQILHPSPASPAANRGWAEKVTAELRALGVCHD
jgi:single-strand selective monofunctional uracil DNA glycosylase